MNARIDLKASLRPNVSLSKFCTMQVGGPALYFAEPSTEEDLTELVDFARQENLPWMILGKGSNVIFPDDGFPGLVITTIHYDADRIQFDEDSGRLTASSGIHLYRLVLACKEAGFSGLEFLANVPGTLGGALIMNAGFSRFPGQKNEIGTLVEEVTVLQPDGRKETLKRFDLQFSYRHSNLEGKVLLSGTLQLWRRDPAWIDREIRANFDYRNAKQDMRYPSSGSIFKNPPPPAPSAGQLIEKAGLKGFKIGGAMVSERHANYIVNTGGAKSSEVTELISKIQKTVFDETGIALEPEVRVIPKT